MMKYLVREVPFGKATARVTVTMFTEIGVFLNENVIDTTKVEIVSNGKVVASGHFAKVLEFDNITDTFYEKANLDVTKKYTRVGDKAVTLGEEVGNLINATIEELKAELAKEFNVETEVEKQEKAAVEEAQVVVAQAEKEGIENLMTADQIKSWRKKYNTVNNEGGEGFIPVRISREEYRRSLDVINRKGVV